LTFLIHFDSDYEKIVLFKDLTPAELKEIAERERKLTVWPEHDSLIMNSLDKPCKDITEAFFVTMKDGNTDPDYPKGKKLEVKDTDLTRLKKKLHKVRPRTSNGWNRRDPLDIRAGMTKDQVAEYEKKQKKELSK